MKSTNRRQNLLFIGAVVVPSTVLLLFGARMVRQERDLAASRSREERRRSVALTQQELLTRLETIKLRAVRGQAGPGDAEVALVARVKAGQVRLPWQAGTATRSQATERAQRELRRAAALAKAGDQTAAAGIAVNLVGLPADIRDEYGVPVAVYAARSLAYAASSRRQREIRGRIEALAGACWLSPAALYMIADTLGVLDDKAGSASIRKRAEELAQADHLTAQLPLLENSQVDPLWLPSGEWLVSLSGRRGQAERTLVAVRAHEVFRAAGLVGPARRVRLASGDGEPLGEMFPGLRLVLADSDESGRLGPGALFYSAALIVVLSTTGFSAYLLRRDVRREARLAALRSQFVSSVSHELRTPLSTIRAYAELLEMGRAGNQISQYMQTILGECERLSRLVEGVLEFARIEHGKDGYRLSPVRLDEVIRSALQAIEHWLAQGGFEVKMSLEPDVPPVQADRDAIERAVANLLSNAIKYSRDQREIAVSLCRENSHAVIRVQDRGVGIAPANQPRIFEKFYRASLPDGLLVPGTGLGLTLVDQIVRSHHGRVAVESQVGQGSTFSIFLPIPAKA